MKKHKKRILGLVGLFGVIGMTAFAINLPTPSAIAASGSASATITVMVENPNQVIVDILSPLDGSTLINNNLSVFYNHANVNSFTATLNEEVSGIINSDIFAPASPTGSGTYDYVLPNYGKYTFTLSGTGDEGLDEDSISFEFIPLDVEDVSKTEEGDPVIEVDYDPIEVCYIMVQAYTKPSFTPLFEPPLSVTLSSLDDNTINIPFLEHEAKSGEYQIEIQSYSCSDSDPIYEPLIIPFTYTEPEAPDVPDVPKTGALLEKLNISKTDYLISGLLIFFFTGIALLVFVKKKSKN